MALKHYDGLPQEVLDEAEYVFELSGRELYIAKETLREICSRYHHSTLIDDDVSESTENLHKL